ncbi:MAG: L,D-transpeptidase family protein [Chloroflexota bacterium]
MSLLEEGIALARTGSREGARDCFRRVIQTEPASEEAWLWLAWVSDTREQAQVVLAEARAFLPESDRIREALVWSAASDAVAKPAASRAAASARAPTAQAAADEAAPNGNRTAERLRDMATQVDQAAQTAQRTLVRTVDRVRDGLDVARTATQGLDFRGLVMPILSGVVAALVLVAVWLGISNARKGSGKVVALELPPLVANATATPAPEQRTREIWAQVDAAWTRENWDAVIQGLDRIRTLDPYNAEARARLAEAYQYRGARCISENKLAEAALDLDTAIRLDARSTALQSTRRQLSLYVQGIDAYWQGQWQPAVQRLRRVHELNPNFRDTRAMLAESYYRYGVDLQGQERWDEAQDVYQRSLGLNPNMDDCRARLAVVNDVITPPKRIVVDLSDKRVSLYENHQVIRTFRICIGRPSAPTVAGRYSVLDKMPMAYASKWDLNMPWWLGIYWAGGSENGFHALPILSNGSTLWSGSLGTGCSFGCIVLDTKDAIMLYNWAEVGDVVMVNY